MIQIPRGYSLSAYAEMLTNAERADAYIEAMRQTIEPGAIVLDIGAGPGFFSMLAAQMGAARVIAVEPNPSIRLAQRLVRDNNLEDRIVCIEGVSTDLNLAQKANVIVSDMRSVLPLFSHHLPSIIDARERLLAPNGKLIPRRDVLMAAPVSNESEHRRITHPWHENKYGLDLSAGADLESNRWTKVYLELEHLLAEAKVWYTLDYEKLSHCEAHGQLEWEIDQPGVVHGIASWFDAELTSGVGFSNQPGKPKLIYGQAFFPLPRGIQTNRGDVINCEMHAHWVGGEYIWHWKGEAKSRAGNLLDSFDQSTVARRLRTRVSQSPII